MRAGTQIAIHPKSPVPGAFLRQQTATYIKYHDHETSLNAEELRAEFDFDGDLGDDQDIQGIFLMVYVLLVGGKMTSIPQLTTTIPILYIYHMGRHHRSWFARTTRESHSSLIF